MPTFDGRNEKFEQFEELLQTSLKTYPHNTEKEERFHYFHSLHSCEDLVEIVHRKRCDKTVLKSL